MDQPQGSGPALTIRHTGQVFPVTRSPVSVGRSPDNIVVLSDPKVSRHHGTFFWQAGKYYVQDLDSANGTHLDEKRISGTVPLRNGAVVRMGNTVFEVSLPPAQPAAQPTRHAEPPSAGSSSALPIILALLLAGIVIIGLAIVAILLLSGSGRGTPDVIIQSPTEGAQIVVGNEIVLQATASGAKNIIRVELKVNDLLVATALSPDPEGASSLTVSQPWIFGQVGPYVITAQAFTANQKESDPAQVRVTAVDSLAQATPTNTPSPGDSGPLPDLLVSHAKVELETGGDCNFTSTELGVRAWIQNVGAADAGPFVVEVNGAQQTVAGGLAAGQTTSLWFPGYNGGGENIINVDVNNQVPESNEDNNRFAQRLPVPTLPVTCTPPPPDSTDTPTPTPTFTPSATPTPTPTTTFTPSPTPTPTDTPPQYDLYVRRMDFSPNLMVGETIEMAVMIATDIYPSSGPFFPASHFRWRQGPSYSWQEEVCPENANYASCTKSVFFTYSAAGNYLVEVEADSRNEVRETDESNNHKSWTITVNPQPPQIVTFNFETYPDGTPTGTDTILNGDEFLAAGVRLEGAPAAVSSCGGAATVPIIRRAQYGIAGAFLTTARADDANMCNFGPLGVRFTSPVRRVTLTFAGAAVTYTMEARDSGDGFLGSASRAAAVGGTFDVTLSSTVDNIARVTLTGPPGALTAITQITYER